MNFGPLISIQFLIVSLLFVLGSCSLSAQPQTQDRPTGHLDKLILNNGKVLMKGTCVRVTAVVTLSPSSTEAFEFKSTITVRRKLFRPFYTVLYPMVRSKQKLSWWTCVTWPKMRIRFLMTARGLSTRTTYNLININRSYLVRRKYNAIRYPRMVLQSTRSAC